MEKRAVTSPHSWFFLALLLLGLFATGSEAAQWKPTLVGVPSGRAYHTAVWTGSQMIVWGGLSDSGYSNTGGRYNPSTDSWTPVSTTGAPSARKDHTAVWTGTQMIVWGGYNGAALKTGGQYDPSGDTWTATSISGAPGVRYGHTAVWTDSQMIVWGGWNGASFLNTGGRYTP